MSVIRYATSVRNSHSALWMVIIGVINVMSSSYIVRLLAAEIKMAIAEFKERGPYCNEEDIQDALKLVLEGW